MQTSTEINNGRATLKLEGRFESSAHCDFRTSCDSVLDTAEVKELELDLAGVNYFDGPGLGVLLLLKERADIARKRMILSNCQDPVKQLIDIANLKEILDVA